MTIATGSQILAADILSFRLFYELAGGEDHTATGADAWEDWDISGIVPAGTKSVLLGITGNNQIVGARKNGSALTRFMYGVQPTAFNYPFQTVVCECDSNRVIEIYSATDTVAEFNILGYWL